MLGPRGEGTTRRRASDAFRLGLALIVVAVSIPVMQASSAAELKIAHVLAVVLAVGIAAALGASLHAVGQQASLATILVVMTLASIIGGAVPVPGGPGVVEAGLIAGLPAPIWGWSTLAWMRRREYV